MGMSRQCKMRVIFWLSMVMFLSGLLVILSSIIITQGDGWNFGDEIVPPEFKFTKNFGLVILWICAFVAIGEGVLGILLAKCDKRRFVMLYGSGLGVISILVLLVGVTFAMQSKLIPQVVNAICTQKGSSQEHEYMQTSYTDTWMLKECNDWMCSEDCACNEVLFNYAYGSTPEKAFVHNGRTKENAPGKIPIKLVPTGGISTFQECWNNSREAKTTNQTLVAKMNAYLKVMKVLEPQFNCSGMCAPALFWFTRQISSQPQGPCLKMVSDNLAGTYTFPGACCIVVACAMFLVFGFQYLLWCDSSKTTQGPEEVELKDEGAQPAADDEKGDAAAVEDA